MSFGGVPQTVVSGSGGALDSLSRVAGLLDRAEPAVRRRFLLAVDAAGALEDLESIATLLEQGRIDEALRIADSVAPSLATSLEGVYAAAGLSAAEVLRSQTGTLFEFNSLNRRAVASLQENRLRLIREFSRQQREATERLLVDAFERGLAPIEQARTLRRSIGLTRRQAESVVNYRRLLEQGSREALTRDLRDRRFDPTVRAAVRGDRVLTSEQIDRMVERYEARALQMRARTIARTETLRSLHEGDKELWDQAVEAGEVEEDDIVLVWHTAGDERVRSSHRALNLREARVGEAFISGAGNSIRYPGDPSAPPSETINCRCVLAREVARAARRRRRAA